MNRRTYRWPSGGCPKLQPPRNGIDYSISIKIRGLRAVLSNAPSDTPQTREKPGRGNPGKPGTVTNYPRCFAGDPVTVPGFAPRECSPRRPPTLLSPPTLLRCDEWILK